MKQRRVVYTDDMHQEKTEGGEANTRTGKMDEKRLERQRIEENVTRR